MNIIFEYVFINPDLDEIKIIKNKTIKDYIKKYGDSYWKRLDYKYNIWLFDKKRIQQKILQLTMVRIEL